MIVLSGGTGTPKLIDGLRAWLPDEEISVIVNTAEDIWISGTFVSPDVDTVLYLFSGDLDKNRWWGMTDETYTTYNQLKKMGKPELLMLGDRDRANNLIRTELLKTKTLSYATLDIAKKLGVNANIIPMSDDPVKTRIFTPEGVIHFQDFWVGKKGAPDVFNFSYFGIKNAKISPRAKTVLSKENYVIIGPSNPMTSIGPMLALPGMREILKNKKVIAISPIIGTEPISGPAGKLMKAKKMDVTAKAVAEFYQDIIDIFVYDIRDTVINPEEIRNMGIKPVAFDTLMTDFEKRKDLAEKVLELLDVSKNKKQAQAHQLNRPLKKPSGRKPCRRIA
ncbi:2-phospho-L-lactate transferase [Methanolapillus ohkumae]|uniref:2-phospho-L-lactate transferase n=1 Tax=Methanolapillus ohkumae TaxID=3028298 RepID=A0AA96VFM8_9EURY|nr:Phosphoenolpyruvate transferase [Methanosarcinaceae archaeon Am2]